MSETVVEIPDYLQGLEVGGAPKREQEKNPNETVMLGDISQIPVEDQGRRISLRRAAGQMSEVRTLKLEAEETRDEIIREQKREQAVIEAMALVESTNNMQPHVRLRIEQACNGAAVSKDPELATVAEIAMDKLATEGGWNNGATMEYARELNDDVAWGALPTEEEKRKLEVVFKSKWSAERKALYAATYCALMSKRNDLEVATKQRKGVAAKIREKLGQGGDPFDRVEERDDQLTTTVISAAKEILEKRVKQPGPEVSERLRTAESVIKKAADERYTSKMDRPSGVTDAQWEQSQGIFNRVSEVFPDGDGYLPDNYNRGAIWIERSRALEEHKRSSTHPVGQEFLDLRNALAVLVEGHDSSNPALEAVGVVLMREAIGNYESRIVGMLRDNGVAREQARLVALQLSEGYRHIIAKNRTIKDKK